MINKFKFLKNAYSIISSILYCAISFARVKMMSSPMSPIEKSCSPNTMRMIPKINRGRFARSIIPNTLMIPKVKVMIKPGKKMAVPMSPKNLRGLTVNFIKKNIAKKDHSAKATNDR